MLRAHILTRKNNFKSTPRIENIVKVVTIIIPRHILRCENILSLTNDLDLDGQIIKHSNELKKISEIIIINSFEMTKYFSFVIVYLWENRYQKLEKVGGQNPIEPAKCGCKYITVPISQILKKYIVC